MKKTLALLLIIIVILSCSNNNRKNSKSNYKIAEEFIENMEPQKAIPYLKKITPEEQNYERAQKLLKTINSFSISEEVSRTNTNKETTVISNEVKAEILVFQKKWSELLIENYEGYLVDYSINDENITFTLSKEASKSGTIKVHEDNHIQGYVSSYYEELEKSNLPHHQIQIHLTRKRGISNNLSSSMKGWLPAEHLWYNVVLYYGDESEKKYVGKVIKGIEIDEVKYVVIKTKSGTMNNKLYKYITQSAFYIKKDDPNIRTRILKFN